MKYPIEGIIVKKQFYHSILNIKHKIKDFNNFHLEPVTLSDI